jgi:ferredoxin-NADP reductase
LFTATLTQIQQATPSVKAFQLKVDDPAFHFLAGQWIDLQIELAGTPHRGGYSMTSSPEVHGKIELAIKSSTRHPVTRWLHEQARVGDTVQISGGQGVFVYQPEMSQRIVLVGAGVGVTPLISIYRYVADAVPGTDATLVYSIPSPDEFLFRDEIERLSQQFDNLHSLVSVTQADVHWHGLSGRTDAALLQRAGMSNDTLYYLCGPQGMVEDVSAMLASLNVPASRIIYEKWW